MSDEATPRTPLATFLLANCTFLSDAALLGLLTPSQGQNNPPPCPICYTPLISSDHRIIQINLPGCTHIFCAKCLSRHILAGYNTCPMCRAEWFHIPLRATTARTAANDLEARAWYYEARGVHLIAFASIVGSRIVRVLNRWEQRREDIALPAIVTLAQVYRNFAAAFREEEGSEWVDIPEETLASFPSTQSSSASESQEFEESEGVRLLLGAQRQVWERHQARVREMRRARNDSAIEEDSNASSSEATQSSDDGGIQAIGVNSRVVLRPRDNMGGSRRPREPWTMARLTRS